MKKSLFVALTLVSAFAFGEVDDTVITFSTPGPDKYADGSTVLDGECYALVWTKDGATFGGLTADCKPVSSTDKVVLIAPAAEGGRCPTIVFEINAKYAAANYQGGTYAVYLLDTRIGKGKLAKVVNGVPQVVNKFGNVHGKGAKGVAGAGFGEALDAKASVALADVGVYSEIESPKIETMEIAGAKIVLTVSGMSEAADYFVVPGESPDAFAEALSTKPEGNVFTFDKPKKAGFFKVVGARKFE